MGKLFNILLIFVLSASSACAQTLTLDQIKTGIAVQVKQDYKQYTDARLDTTILALPFPSLTVPNGKVTYQVTSHQKKFMARDLKKVDVYVNDKLAKTFNAPLDVKAYKSVLVASTFIEREKGLSKENTKIKEIEVANILEYTMSENMLDRELTTKKFFKEDEVIDKRFVKFRPDVNRYSTVTTIFNTNGIEIALEGVSLNDGMVGEYVNVEHKGYKRIYTGKVIGANRVWVKI